MEKKLRIIGLKPKNIRHKYQILPYKDFRVGVADAKLVMICLPELSLYLMSVLSVLT